MNCSIIRPAAEVPRDFLISHSLCSFDPPQRHIMVTASLFCSSWRKQLLGLQTLLSGEIISAPHCLGVNTHSFLVGLLSEQQELKL